MTIRFFTIFILSVLLNINSFSQNPYKYSFDGSLSFGRVIAHRNSMRRMVDKNSYSAELTFNLHTNGLKHYHKKYNSIKFHDRMLEKITFANHNLVTDGVFGEMNLIL